MNTERSRQEAASTYAAWLKERIEQQGILRKIAGYPNFVVWHYKEENGQRLKPHCQQSQPARIRASALCSRTARLPALILPIASGKAAYRRGRRRSSIHLTPTPSIHRHGTEQQAQAVSTSSLKANRQPVKKPGTLKCTGKSTT